MRVRRAVIGCVLAIGLSYGCGGGSAPGTPEGNLKAVKDVEAAWVRDIATKDVEKFAAYYADDASVLLPYEPIIIGKAKIREALKPMLADPNFALTFQTTHGEASKGDDLVYTIGTYSMTVTEPIDKKPMTDKGKFVTVFKKQGDGSWKVVVDTFNSDLPPPNATYR